jgi:hypothetical protein
MSADTFGHVAAVTVGLGAFAEPEPVDLAKQAETPQAEHGGREAGE